MKRLVIKAIGLTCGIAILLTSTAAADPSRFVVVQCKQGTAPDGATATLAYNRAGLNPDHYQFENGCSGNTGYLTNYMDGAVGAFSEGDLSVGGVTPGGYNAGVTFTGAELYPGGSEPGTRTNFIFYGPNLYNTAPTDPTGNWHTDLGQGGDVRFVTLQIRCESANPCPADSRISGHNFQFHTVDPNPPVISAESGSLIGEGTVRGPQDLAVSASDQGGGISDLFVLVNGIRAAGDRQACSTSGSAAINFSPCPASAQASFNLNTEGAPFRDGENEVRTCAQDFANEGLAQLSCTTHSVRIDNSCAGSPVAGGQNLSLTFRQSNSDTAVVAADSGATATGTLSDGSGNPVRGATLCIKEQTLLPGANPADVATVRTDRDGEYTYTVNPGPNRMIRVGYRFNRTQIGRAGKYLAHAKPTLKLAPRKTRNHKRIRIWGDIPGPESGGRVVVLQARYPHSKQWKTFKQAKTDGNGRYATRYRFTATYATTKYRFRALLPEQNGYPYLDGVSRKVKVKVLGG